MTLLRVLLFTLGLIFCTDALECGDSPIQDASGPLVTTENGKVLGKYQKVLDGQVAAFLGIPFAEPPLGQRRFTKPIPNQGWNGILEAQHLPPPCMQYSKHNHTWVPDLSTASEDCLYLNVWVPVNHCHLEKLPVMVWIYGGGFTTGSSSVEWYDGSVLASRGDVVVVSFNYRVGIFGFLNAGNAHAPGNAGLHDQVLALKWVQQNIGNFNGDPNSVTLFGESAGAMSIGMHLVSPLSKGLFHRAILQSGSAYGDTFFDNPRDSISKINLYAQSAGCSDETKNMDSDPSHVIECLKSKDARELAQLTTPTSAFGFMPSLDNDFLTRHPILSYEAGDFYDVPILTGATSNEGTIILNFFGPDMFPADKPLSEDAESYRGFVNMLKKAFPEEIFKAYFGDALDDSKVVVEGIEKIYSDFFFLCPAFLFAEKMNKVYMYSMSYRSEKSPLAEWMGTPHFDDIQYVFGKPLVDSDNYTPEDSKFSEDMIEKWVNFAKNGSPLKKDSELEQYWPLFDSSKPTVLELSSKEPRLIAYPSHTSCEIWKSFFHKNLE